MLFDGLINLITRMGTGRDKNALSQFGFNPIARAELENLFRDDWVGNKIVRIPAQDMTRNGREWKASPDQVRDLEKAERELKLSSVLQRALIWQRLYGGSAILVDDGNNPSSPINPERVRRGGIRAFHVLGRERLNITELERDIRSPNFGMPKNVTLAIGTETNTQLHPSRLIYFHGAETPDTDMVDDFWGDSVLRAVYSAVRNAASSQENIAGLVHEAKSDIIAVKGLAQQVQDPQAKEALLARWGLAKFSKSNNGAMLIDADNEEYIERQLNFTNYDDLMMAFLVIVSGAADIPATRMLGQAPKGLNATGESDLRNYYNSIESAQQAILGPALEKIDSFLIPHALGSRPDEIWYDFRPLWTPTEKEQADIHKTKAEAVKIHQSLGTIDPRAFQRGHESLLIEDGLLPGFEAAMLEIGEDDRDLGEILPEEEGEAGDPETNEPQGIADAAPRTLYVHRPVKNAADIIRWAKAQGIPDLMDAEDLHVTIAYSKHPVDWMAIDPDWHGEITIEGGARIVEPLGDKGAIVLLFASSELQWRWRAFCDFGCSWDWEQYQPHITVSYAGDAADLTEVEPYTGPIVLGPERFEEIDEQGEEKRKA